MAIQGTPRNGMILMCDFDQHENELVSDGNMRKTRMVIAISPSHARRGKIVHVVPISMTAPEVVMPWHIQIPLDCLPHPARHRAGDRWAKCDMVVTAGWSRLNRYEGPKRGGQVAYADGFLNMDTLARVKVAIAHVFGIRRETFDYGKAAAAANEGLDAALGQAMAPAAAKPEPT